jgi:hypothetical protein
MKKIYILATLALFSFNLWAQKAALSITPSDSAYVIGPLDDILKAEFKIKNTTTNSLDVTWERNDGTIPKDWELTVCDPVACFPPTTKVAKFTLMAGQSGTLLVDAFPNLVAGTGLVTVKLTPKGLPTQTLKIKYFATKPVGTNDLSFSKVTFAPNPASDYFTLKNFDTQIKTLKISNLLGKNVKTFSANEGENYDISDLVRGTYLVSMLDQNGKILVSKKLLKAN